MSVYNADIFIQELQFRIPIKNIAEDDSILVTKCYFN